MGFFHRLLAAVNLPHRDPGNDTRVWLRRNGLATLSLQQGFTKDDSGLDKPIGYPYGMIPRLVLIFLITEAVRTQKPQIELGSSMTDFLRAVGLRPNSRLAPSVRKQIIRLFAASIRITFVGKSSAMGASGMIADDFVLWWDKTEPSQSSLWRSFVILNGGFFKEVVKSPLPIDLGIVAGLRQSSLSLDLYLFLTCRVYTLRHPLRISMQDLEIQLGSNYKERGEFSRECSKALRRIKFFWPQLHYKRVRGGLELTPSSPSVPRLTPKSNSK